LVTHGTGLAQNVRFALYQDKKVTKTFGIVNNKVFIVPFMSTPQLLNPVNKTKQWNLSGEILIKFYKCFKFRHLNSPGLSFCRQLFYYEAAINKFCFSVCPCSFSGSHVLQPGRL
jgi:hypothetical protein